MSVAQLLIDDLLCIERVTRDVILDKLQFVYWHVYEESYDVFQELYTRM